MDLPTSAAVLRLADYGRMTIDIELLLAGHPFLFLGWEGGIKGFHCCGILAAIGGGTGNVHPLSAVQRTGHKLTNEKRCGEVAVHHKADILLFAADKATADIVARIAEIDVHIITHLACNFKGMLDQYFAEFLPLVFGCNTKRPKREDLFPVAIFVLKPGLCVHDVSDDLASQLQHKRKLWDEIRVRTHLMHIIMLIRTGLIDVPKCLTGQFFYGFDALSQICDNASYQ